MPIHPKEKIEKAIKIEDLVRVHEYRRVLMIIDQKPSKAEKLIREMLKSLRSGYIGLPVYNHLLQLHVNTLISTQNFEEAELQIKNLICNSQNKFLYDPEYRVSHCISLNANLLTSGNSKVEIARVVYQTF